jgi:hypothetical protein
LKGGIETTDYDVIYWSVPKLSGASYAESKDVFMTKDSTKKQYGQDRK